jgi:hypothetical protein
MVTNSPKERPLHELVSPRSTLADGEAEVRADELPRNPKERQDDDPIKDETFSQSNIVEPTLVDLVDLSEGERTREPHVVLVDRCKSFPLKA